MWPVSAAMKSKEHIRRKVRFLTGRNTLSVPNNEAISLLGNGKSMLTWSGDEFRH